MRYALIIVALCTDAVAGQVRKPDASYTCAQVRALVDRVGQHAAIEMARKHGFSEAHIQAVARRCL